MSADVRPTVADYFPLDALVRSALGDEQERWRLTVRRPWCHVHPVDATATGQGWKLHLSATPLSAPLVLVAATRVLAAHWCVFKFASTLNDVRELGGARAHRGSSGKFITVYPRDDEQFRSLAEELDLATRGLPGPAILSDRRYRPGSLVHYRYGAFSGLTRLSNDGSYQAVITAPDGGLVPDQRKAWFTPPAWAPNPFPATSTATRARTKPAGVLLNDRYEVRRALQHANKGGVYLAHDRATGTDAVIKQARPHTQASVVGSDGRDILRHEATMLDRLAGTGVAPGLIEVFEQGGDLFLAEQFVPGTVLRMWVAQQVWRYGEVPVAAVRAIGRQLVDLVRTVHERGLVLRDLSPNNVMVTPDGETRIVDLEYVVVADPDAMARKAYTPGYAAPDVRDADSYGSVPAADTDLYSLGATLFHLATGCDPIFLPDSPVAGGARDDAGRLAGLIAAMRPDAPGLREFGDLVQALMRTDPGSRCRLADAAAVLRAGPVPPPSVVDVSGTGDRPGAGPSLDDTIQGALRQLRQRVDASARGELTRSSLFAATTDRCTVQHGAAGVLAVLTRAARLGLPGVDRDAVAEVADWIVRHLPAEQRTLPGLYFGRSGVAWALADAARLLADDPARNPGESAAAELARAAAGLADRIPVVWPNPDVCHGAAGAGLAQLHLWRDRAEPALLDRVRACADGLAKSAEWVDGQVWWPVPTGFESVLAGTAQLGFGHGLAGVATFLLQAAGATGDQRHFDLAVAAGQTLVATAVRDADAAWWPGDRSERTPTRRHMSAHWCTGASGIGTFLIRLWAASADEQYRELAEAAARTAWRARWTSAPVQCHGSAGDGELLLDLAQFTGDEVHRQRAERLAEIMVARAAVADDGSLVFPDESHVDAVADFQTGLSGTLSYLVRLRHGGRRAWLVDSTVDAMGPRS